MVGAASRHGATAEIADRIADHLARSLSSPWSVSRSDLTDLTDLDGADGVVLGSAIYLGRWMHRAKEALERVQDASTARLWLFSTGPVSDSDSENEQAISADVLAMTDDADEHMVFGGKLDPSTLSLAERLVVKAVHAPAGDHRDWDAVDAWARHIAVELGARPESGTNGTSVRGNSL